ncbi:response regulator receiver domain-containing protein [Flavobacterium araucananum]|nr:response regulator receiver domain-containing protein [Flavobacterium araucananum]
MLVDDDKIGNFFHERVIRKYKTTISVIIKESAEEALYYLQNKECNENTLPVIIFLDINMPGMNGWEFLEEYKNLDKKLHCKVILVILTTSQNTEDIFKAKSNDIIFALKTKPLDKEILDEIFQKYCLEI